MTIRALVFDAYGTLYDVQSVLAKAEAVCPGKGEVITQIWRLKQLEYSWLRSLMQEYEDFWVVTGAALDFALRAAGVEPKDATREPLMENYLHLDPYPEARVGLAALTGHKLAILSNGSPRMLQQLVRNSGLDRWIEAAISVDSVRAYKPHRSCYALVEPALGVSEGGSVVRLVEQLRCSRRQGLRFCGRLDPPQWRGGAGHRVSPAARTR